MSSTPSRSDWSIPSTLAVAWSNLLSSLPKKPSPLDIDPPRNTLRRHSSVSGSTSTTSDVYYLHSYGSLNLP